MWGGEGWLLVRLARRLRSRSRSLRVNPLNMRKETIAGHFRVYIASSKHEGMRLAFA